MIFLKYTGAVGDVDPGDANHALLNSKVAVDSNPTSLQRASAVCLLGGVPPELQTVPSGVRSGSLVFPGRTLRTFVVGSSNNVQGKQKRPISSAWEQVPTVCGYCVVKVQRDSTLPAEVAPEQFKFVIQIGNPLVLVPSIPALEVPSLLKCHTFVGFKFTPIILQIPLAESRVKPSSHTVPQTPTVENRTWRMLLVSNWVSHASVNCVVAVGGPDRTSTIIERSINSGSICRDEDDDGDEMMIILLKKRIIFCFPDDNMKHMRFF